MPNDIKELLSKVASGETDVDDALLQLKRAPFEDLGFAKVDLHRSAMQGHGEVVYGAGKTASQIAQIAKSLSESGQERVLVTRLEEAAAVEVEAMLGAEAGFRYNECARIGYIGNLPDPDGIGKVLVVCAGTSDLPVAEEAAFTLEMYGNETKRIFDVGVAGIHRLLSHIDEIGSATAIVAVAGMEGALASVVGGLAECPVIAVPTSVGYGASFDGLAALLSMLNSCASGVGVVNIDNGFGAACLASKINHVRPSEEARSV